MKCGGARLQGGYFCLEHLPEDRLLVLVARLRDGDALDARNTTISHARLTALLDGLRVRGTAVLPRADFHGARFSESAPFYKTNFSQSTDFTGATFIGDARFVGATFSDNAYFAEATFSDDATFLDATFSASTRFDRTTFSKEAVFQGACFGNDARFEEATFSGDAYFGGATFSSKSVFHEATFSASAFFHGTEFSNDGPFAAATFSGYAGFQGATFKSNAAFHMAIFGSDARFDGVSFGRRASFDRATFDANVRFSEARFNGELGFTETTFVRASELGALAVDGRLVLDDAVFVERVRLDIAARELPASAATFAGGVLLRVRWAEMAFDNADFARPSALSAATTWDPETDIEVEGKGSQRALPQLWTLAGAHVAELSISNVDLHGCRFFGAHGLESLTIEESCVRIGAPTSSRFRGRETIAEEHLWRCKAPATCWITRNVQLRAWLAGRDSVDHLESVQLPAWLASHDDVDRLKDPAQVARLYRALRTARERSNDHAGAADLYYGEMEMRRRQRESLADRMILPVYRWIAGYGLRPARAFATLALLLLVSTGLLHWFGFHDPRNYGRSLLVAIESSVSLLQAPAVKLSAGGEIVQIALRLLGPLLLGLALLAIRARIKR